MNNQICIRNESVSEKWNATMSNVKCTTIFEWIDKKKSIIKNILNVEENQ